VASSRELTLGKAGDKVAEGLGFVAYSVVVDNYTNSFVRIRGAARDVPPNLFGVVIAIEGTQVAEAELVATVPAVPTPPYPITGATVVFVSDRLPPAAGHQLQLSTQTAQQPLLAKPTDSGVYVFADTVRHTIVFPLPAGTQSVRWNAVTTPATFTHFTVTGNVTGRTYVTLEGNTQSQTNELDSDFRVFPVDTSLTLDFQITAGTSTHIPTASVAVQHVIAELSGKVGVFNGFPVYVARDSSILPPKFEQRNAQLGSGSVVAFSLIPNGGVVTLLTGQANRYFELNGLDIVFDAAPAPDIFLQDSTGQFLAVVAGNATEHLRLDGVPTAVGADLQLFNNSGVNRNGLWVVRYSVLA
jgi:hypothetical protein